MKKRLLAAVLPVLILVLLSVFPNMALAGGGFAIGPPSIHVTVPADSESRTYVYITSGFDGEIAIGTENIPFRIEPETISVSSTDQNRRIELTFYGDRSVAEGTYSGKLTFLAYASGNVTHGVKINADVTQAAPEQSGQVAEAGEGKESSILDTVKDNYIMAVLAILAVAALFVGIMIGRKKKGETRRG
jgi:hypothetical protein